MPRFHDIVKNLDNTLEQIKNFLDKNKIDVTETDRDGKTAIIVAIEQKRYDVATEIARRYRYVSGSSFDSALLLATQHHQQELVEALLQANTPTTFRRRLGHESFCKIKSDGSAKTAPIVFTNSNVYLLGAISVDDVSQWLFPLLDKYEQNKKTQEKAFNVAISNDRQIVHEFSADTSMEQAAEVAEKLYELKQNTECYEFTKDPTGTFCVTAALTGRNANKLTRDLALNEVLNKKIQGYRAAFSDRNPFEAIYIYFVHTYRPEDKDYKARFTHFAKLLAQVSQNALDVAEIKKEVEVFRSKVTGFFGRGPGRYFTLVNELLKMDMSKLQEFYKSFEDSHIKDKKTYLGLTEEVGSWQETLKAIADKSAVDAFFADSNSACSASAPPLNDAPPPYEEQTQAKPS